MAKIAYHAVTGATEFPYDVDANAAVSRHPDQWSWTPWPREAQVDAHKAAVERHTADVEDAKAAGQPLPAPPVPPVEPTAEESAAIDADAQAKAEAAERVAAYDREQVERQARDAQIAADRALLAQPPPQPDPSRPKRPFGRAGEPTPAEAEMMRKRDAKAAQDAADKSMRDEADRKAQADKAAADQGRGIGNAPLSPKARET